eukprot:CAMPEP_0197034578 /NCGR_PEP_ID=MMETSP1384-20130603/12654_1 /TAXON_ID=29189 /ORGANISM="Ammonia sp." /LENGTH=257 /DNA_ID=CAMNT_0042464527 /DNA_START=20 /DNA_END=790 /DNA_ORIENTATION=-
MAQPSVYYLPSGSGAADDNHIDELMANIALDIQQLQEILDQVGSSTDTRQQRQRFTDLRDRVNDRIRRATRFISRSVTSDDLRNEAGNIDYHRYQLEVQQYTSSLRTIVASAIKLFQTNSPQTTPKQKVIHVNNGHDERSPLLSAQHQMTSFDSIAKNVKVVDEQALLEQEEEKMADIHESIQDMTQMFKELDEIVNEQEEKVDALEVNIGVARDHVVAGKEHLDTAEVRASRSRANKIVILVVLVVVLAIIIAFVW